jgi:UDP-3-O-[3-hydroxymyristoyl] N-acetylglucosamine deacetylase
MDGFISPDTARRHTLKTSISCVGVGVHSGRRASLTLRPALPGAGIRFRRTDLGIDIPATYAHVTETRLCTALSLPDQPEARIGTVEHVMAALAGCGIDDALIEVDGPEVPILDGSAAPFVFLIDCAGVISTIGAPDTIEVLRTIRVQDGEGPHAPWVELSPLPLGAGGFDAALTIDFPGTAIGRQHVALRITPASFRHELADARTFTLAAEVEHLRAMGLAQGGDLSNAIVVDGAVVLNPGGLRRPDEFVRHKLLDVVGDLALAGASLRACFRGHRSGHALNNRLLRALFADEQAWRRLPAARVTDGVAAVPMRAAAYPAMA